MAISNLRGPGKFDMSTETLAYQLKRDKTAPLPIKVLDQDVTTNVSLAAYKDIVRMGTLIVDKTVIFKPGFRLVDINSQEPKESAGRVFTEICKRCNNNTPTTQVICEVIEQTLAGDTLQKVMKRKEITTGMDGEMVSSMERLTSIEHVRNTIQITQEDVYKRASSESEQAGSTTFFKVKIMLTTTEEQLLEKDTASMHLTTVYTKEYSNLASARAAGYYTPFSSSGASWGERHTYFT